MIKFHIDYKDKVNLILDNNDINSSVDYFIDNIKNDIVSKYGQSWFNN